MAHRRKRSPISKAVPRKFEGFADLLSKLEVETEKIVRRFIDKAEQSSRELKKGVSSLIEQVRNQGLAAIASEKKEDLLRLVDDVISRAKEIQLLPLGNISRDDIIREAKKNLDDLISRINSADILARARETAIHTKNQVLSILSIPTQTEVVKLSRKITSLEGRVNKLTRKAA